MAGRRPNPPIIHMIVALLVVLAPALLAVAWFQRVPPTTVTAVDAAPVLAAAKAAKLTVHPVNLPDGWVCTRARFTKQGDPGVGGTPVPGNTLGLGYLSPAQTYLAVDQRDAAPDAFIADVTREGTRQGTATVAGRQWERYRSQDGRTGALVLREGTTVTIVSGDLGNEGLEAFASALSFG